jgi:hypothetical protein
LSWPVVSIRQSVYSFIFHLAIVLYKFSHLAISFTHNRDDSRSRNYPHIENHFSKDKRPFRSFYHSCIHLSKSHHLSSAKHLYRVSFLIGIDLGSLTHFTNNTLHSLQDFQLHIFLYRYHHLQITKDLNLAFNRLRQELLWICRPDYFW